jgi:hypothetical protein
MQHRGHLQDLATKPKLTSACDCRTTHYLIIGSHHLPSTVDDTNFAYKEGSQALIFQDSASKLKPKSGDQYGFYQLTKTRNAAANTTKSLRGLSISLLG